MATRVLLIERDVTTSDLLVPSLERKGYQVHLARTRRQATSCCRSVHSEVLIVDVASFGAAGYDVVDAVRPLLDGAPTILLLEEGHAIAGGQAEAFMTPPFTSRKLLYRLKKVAETLPSREIRVGELVFDPVTRILNKGQTRCRLRPKEAALLALCATQAGYSAGRRSCRQSGIRTL